MTHPTETRIRLYDALYDLIKDFDPEMQCIPVEPDGGCIECTSGVTPNHLNTGLCTYHRATAALKKWGES